MALIEAAKSHVDTVTDHTAPVTSYIEAVTANIVPVIIHIKVVTIKK